MKLYLDLIIRQLACSNTRN